MRGAKTNWSNLRRSARGITSVARAQEWWSYKLAPILSVFYATALIQNVSVASTWATALQLLLAIVPGAAYVSIINDITDAEEDARSGKANRLVDKPVWLRTALVAAPLAIGVFFVFLWRDDVPLVFAYLAAWIAFSLYSCPPFRLKTRGFWGIAADASGAHLFPTLVAALLCLRATGGNVERVWLLAVAAWAFACGLRGILWHQLWDLENDRNASVKTFALQHSPGKVVRLARYIVLPIEAAALCTLFWRMGPVIPTIFAVLYALYLSLKVRFWRLAVIIVQPQERYTILGQEYYFFFFPLGILVASATHHPLDWIVLIVHLLVFSSPTICVITDCRKLLRELIAELRFV
jgi:4-hydroxybenzoate polyprenyltransferase